MVKGNVRGVLCGVCCAAAVCLGVGMVEDAMGMDKDDMKIIDGVPLWRAEKGDFYQRYASLGYEIWRSDGERFIAKSFIDEYCEMGNIPSLNDGKPELSDWLKETINTYVFSVEWSSGRTSALEFLENMLLKYSKYEEQLEKTINLLKYAIEIGFAPTF
jgi:hypothetical protein